MRLPPELRALDAAYPGRITLTLGSKHYLIRVDGRQVGVWSLGAKRASPYTIKNSICRIKRHLEGRA